LGFPYREAAPVHVRELRMSEAIRHAGLAPPQNSCIKISGDRRKQKDRPLERSF
jgi:hypothetical protein